MKDYPVFKKGTDNIRLLLWGAVVLSFFINILFIGKSYMIYLSTDEQGPFAAAALLNGVDWSSTTTNLSYYSYGYGFILAPIFALTNSARSLYQGAILVNAVMASAIVPLSYRIGLSLKPDLNKKAMVFLAFAVSHYSAVIVRAHLALYEMTLIFLVWALTALFFSFEEKPALWKYGLFSFLLVYSYTVHQRMLAVVLAGGLSLFIHFLARLRKRKSEAEKEKMTNLLLQAGIALLFIVGTFLIHKALKSWIKGTLWAAATGVDNNDFAGMSGRFDKYLTREGFNSLIKEFFGQMFYMGCATFVIGFVGAFCMLRDNLRSAVTLLSGKKKKSPAALSGYPVHPQAQFFVLAMFGASLMVSLMFMAGGTIRGDYLIYGRYIEMTFGPILLMGLLHLYDKTERPALFSILSLLALIACTVITDYAYGNVRYVEFAQASCVGVNVWYHDHCMHVYEALLWASGIFTVFFLLLRMGKENVRRLALVLLACGWTYVGANLLLNEILPEEKCTYEFNDLLTAREEGTEELPVYYAGPSGKTYEAPFIQYLMKDEILHYIDVSEQSSLTGDYYVINKFSPVEMQEGYRLLGGSNGTFIYRADASAVRDNVMELPTSIFATACGHKTGEGIVNDSAGFLTYGPYLTLIVGTYTVEVQYKILSDTADGYIDVVSGETTHVMSPFSEHTRDENGIYTATLSYSLIETWEREEIRTYVSEGQICVTGVTLSWKSDMEDLPLSVFATDNCELSEDGAVNKTEGQMFAGPYMTWYYGDYTVRITYEVENSATGSFSISSGGTIYDEVPVGEGGVAELSMEIAEGFLRNMSLNCFVDSGKVRITEVTILRDMGEQ